MCQTDKGGFVTGGGGISAAYPLPSWQKSHVEGYFAQVKGTNKKPFPGYSKNGRGYPDITAAGTHYLIVIGGRLHWVGGTSVGAPVVAGMISLVNAARFRAGGKPVGFLNPVLYANSTLFMNDVTSGKNNCTGSTSCCREGFSAAPGWDPASGLGTLNFVKFKRFMMSIKPTSSPSVRPSSQPSNEPTSSPSSAPSPEPTSSPSPEPTSSPSSAPSPKPSAKPTVRPTVRPSHRPYDRPPYLNFRPTTRPSIAKQPSLFRPSVKPTASPSSKRPALP